MRGAGNRKTARFAAREELVLRAKKKKVSSRWRSGINQHWRRERWPRATRRK